MPEFDGLKLVAGFDLARWRGHMGWSQREAADNLGISRTTYRSYEIGTIDYPLYIAYACMFLSVRYLLAAPAR